MKSVVLGLLALGIVASVTPAEARCGCGWHRHYWHRHYTHHWRSYGPRMAICRDGRVSHSRHRSGTCSGHGGVRRWG